MEALELAKARANSASAKQFTPPIILTVDDIKRVISVLDPKNNDSQNNSLEINDLISKDERSVSCRYQVRTSLASCGYRDILLRELKTIRDREAVNSTQTPAESIVVNGKPLKKPKLISEDSSLSVDSMINRVFGAYRSGTYLCWKINDDIYKYDVFKHRLTKVVNNGN